MIPALLIALSVSASAQPPHAVVASVLARAETLVAEQKGKDVSEIRDLDRRAQALSSELKPLGWRAAPALGAAVQDLKRPEKVRLYAASFLGLIRDPAAFAPLEDIMLNQEQPATVRALAAQSLPGQGATDASVSKALCLALAQEDLPREVLEEVLLSLSRLGCPDPGALSRVARAYGTRPGKKDLALVAAAISVLGRSRGATSGKALLELVGRFPALGDSRAAVIMALDARRSEIAAWLAPETAPVVAEALLSESSRRDTMIPLIRLAAALGPETAPALSRLTKHPDAEVLAETAEALAALGRVDAIPALDAVVKGAMSDARFSPQEGRPDPAVTLTRIENALAALRRLR